MMELPAKPKDLIVTYRGKVHQGVVVLQDGINLPDGTEVAVTIASPAIGSHPRQPSDAIWSALAELGQWAESQPCSLPEDLAANHDHYLHSLPKRQ
jgi:hypothetical protein